MNKSRVLGLGRRAHLLCVHTHTPILFTLALEREREIARMRIEKESD